MENKKDNPGIFIPPPLIYAAFFIAAIFLQRAFPITNSFFHSEPSKIIGVTFILINLFFSFPALRQFFISRNTIITHKPANSLQSSGVYSLSRNPMYLSLVLLYLGLTFILGNWWNFIVLPILIWIVQEYIIKHEEKYLERRFGQDFNQYKSRVRRWL
jgi:protein-S-isoprenylcysteine O-methyltransferase Ste14